MSRLCLTIAISVALLAAVNGAVFRGPAPCPDNHVSGETWYPEGCMECICNEEDYQCATCGVYAFNYNTSLCYEETNLTAPYPDCCLPRIVCVGAAGFNSSKLANPLPLPTNTTPKPAVIKSNPRVPIAPPRRSPPKPVKQPANKRKG